MKAISLAKLALVGAVVGGSCAIAAVPAHADGWNWTAVALSQASGFVNAVADRSSADDASGAAVAACNQRIPAPTGSFGAPHDCATVLAFASGKCGAVSVGKQDPSAAESYANDEAGVPRSSKNVYTWSLGNNLTEADIDAVVKNPGRDVKILWSDCQS
ncbi:DUF4189 domain-containing protein [Nocardia sp. NPDC051570]|uniref:DUF4189 domain-containing protein n=1 Tax=Nocardia sp. NPDC051570 TaxID=3364324 RepID=UPI0037A8BF6E